MKYISSFSVEISPKKGEKMLHAKRDAKGGYTADDVTLEKLKGWLAAAKTHGVGCCRWTFYIPEVSQKLAKGDTTMPVAVVEKAIKDGAVPYVSLGGFGQPRITLAKPDTAKATKVAKPAVEVIKL